MFNTTYKGLMDIRARCELIARLGNLEHPQNSNIKLVECAKWVLSKTRGYPAWHKAYAACTAAPLSIPLTEGILIKLDCIEEILEHHNVTV
jgi:hypothetical protein